MCVDWDRNKYPSLQGLFWILSVADPDTTWGSDREMSRARVRLAECRFEILKIRGAPIALPWTHQWLMSKVCFILCAREPVWAICPGVSDLTLHLANSHSKSLSGGRKTDSCATMVTQTIIFFYSYYAFKYCKHFQFLHIDQCLIDLFTKIIQEAFQILYLLKV